MRLPGAAVDEPGAGLGLAIVRRLSSLLDHPLELRSRVGRGTTFRITLPRAAAIAIDDAAPIREARLPLAGLRVLCVDNEPVILDALNALLTRWGAVPTLASGVEAAKAAQGPSTPPWSTCIWATGRKASP